MGRIASEKMISKLAEFGIDADRMNFRLASQMIRKIAANGWRLPEELLSRTHVEIRQDRDPAENKYYGRYRRRYRQSGFATKRRRAKSSSKGGRRKKKDRRREKSAKAVSVAPVYKTNTTVTVNPSLRAPWEEEPVNFGRLSLDVTAECG